MSVHRTPRPLKEFKRSAEPTKLLQWETLETSQGTSAQSQGATPSGTPHPPLCQEWTRFLKGALRAKPLPLESHLLLLPPPIPRVPALTYLSWMNSRGLRIRPPSSTTALAPPSPLCSLHPNRASQRRKSLLIPISPQKTATSLQVESGLLSISVQSSRVLRGSCPACAWCMKLTSQHPTTTRPCPLR